MITLSSSAMIKNFLIYLSLACATVGTAFVHAQTVPDLPVTELPFQSPDADKNPIREGIDAVMDNLEGSFLVESDATFDSSFSKVVAQINVIVNYLLGLLALIALIYLLYHGFAMLFAFNKDDAFNKAREGMKTALVALVGIGLSWVIVRFIFYIVNLVG